MINRIVQLIISLHGIIVHGSHLKIASPHILLLLQWRPPPASLIPIPTVTSPSLLLVLPPSRASPFAITSLSF